LAVPPVVDVSRRHTIVTKPMLASLEQLSGLPPALVITDEVGRAG